MGQLNKDIFVCLDCETTGLSTETDQIIEIAAVRFTLENTLDSYETLIDPEIPINPASMEFHHISDEMVKGKPKVAEVLPELIKFVGKYIIVGHGITTDIAFLDTAAKKFSIPCPFSSQKYIDTLRLARLYGESPTNSLERLRQHFNIAEEGAHRAMSDVIVNIEVFKYLSKKFKTTEELMNRLKSPILLRTMPLGKHKGRTFNDIPLDYLRWMVHQDFDQDLMFSIKSELKKRKQGSQFHQAGNPFADL